jgi:predicted acetyltransferase
MQLSEPPRLMSPTVAVRDSWLAAERAAGGDDGLLKQGLADFGKLVADRQGTPIWWGVPTSIFWWVSGTEYLGEIVIRHELTPDLLASGGHIGYDVATPWRRQGHGTRMLAAGLDECRRLGLRRVLLTIGTENEASRRVCLANGGIHAGQAGGEDRFWISLDGVTSL